jgi:hypothetical protein
LQAQSNRQLTSTVDCVAEKLPSPQTQYLDCTVMDRRVVIEHTALTHYYIKMAQAQGIGDVNALDSEGVEVHVSPNVDLTLAKIKHYSDCRLRLLRQDFFMPPNPILPEIDLHFIMNPYRDETLFSYCSRHHRLSGNSKSSDTCLQLFGHRFAGSQHDLSSRLDEFSARTRGALGTARHIALNRTLLSFLLMFKHQADWDEAIEQLRSHGVGSLKYRLGLLTSGFRANHPLKACSECSAEDLKLCGTTFWHLAHQFPSVFVCPTHGIALAEYQLKANGVGRFLWHLPDNVAATDGRFVDPKRPDLAELRQLASLTNSAVEFSKQHRFDMERLRWCYRSALFERGFLTSGGNLRARKAAGRFCEEMVFISRVPEFEAILTNPNRAAPQLSKILFHPSRQTYPIRHLVIIQWLFGDWDTFFTAYSKAQDHAHELVAHDEGAVGRRRVTDDVSLLNAVRAKLVDEGTSLRLCARDLKIDLKSVMVVAAKLGVTIARRPKKLTLDIRRKLTRDLEGGVEKKIAAAKFDVSVQTVTTTLQTEPGLSAKWHSARRLLARLKNRADWQRAIDANGSFSIKQLRITQPSAYAWLYRNDRQWLAETQELIPPAVRKPTTLVDWDARDEALANEVLITALALTKFDGKLKLSLQDIYRKIPELRAKLDTLSKLPRTQRALDQVVLAGRKAKAGALI